MVVVKVAFAFCVGAFVLAPEALAIEPGVVYEPGSPAGKEYALPLEEARREAGSPGSEGAEPSYDAFGVGIGQPGQRGEASDRGRSDKRGAGGGTDGADRADGDGSGGRSEATVSRAGLADAEAAGGSFGWSAVIMLAVLLPGALFGLTLGRLRHGPPNTSASRDAHRSTE